MIAAVLVGLVLGAILAAVGILWRWFYGIPTIVTANGWPLGPLRSGGWGILLGAVIALGEVLSGKRLRNTWGLSIVLSSVGGLVGGMLAWFAWTALTNPKAEVKP